VGLPVEPGVRQGHDALARWAALLEETAVLTPESGQEESDAPAAPAGKKPRGPLACGRPRLVTAGGRQALNGAGERPGRLVQSRSGRSPVLG
jgi:hypothetical protein